MKPSLSLFPFRYKNSLSSPRVQRFLLFLCQYHTVLITVPLQYSLRLGNLVPLVLLFFLKIVLAIWGILCFHTNFRIILVLWKCHWCFDRNCFEYVDCVEQYGRFNSVLPIHQHSFFPSICVIFDFYHQCHSFLHTGLLSFQVGLFLGILFFLLRL